VLQQLGSTCPLLLILLETAGDEVGELLTYGGESNKRRFLVFVHDLVYFNGVGGLRVRVLAQGHLIEHHTNRPDVTGIRVVLAVKTLGRHVTKGTSVSACYFVLMPVAQLLADAEVRELGSAQLRVNKDVVGLDITMELLPLSV